MAFRNDLDAAHARLSAMEAELADKQQTIDELERQLAEERRARAEVDRTPMPKGVRFETGGAYVPLIALCLRAVIVAFRVRPKAGDRPRSDLAVAWFGHYLWIAFKYAVWLPLYLVALFAIVTPVLLVLGTIGSVVLLPIVVISRVRLGASDGATKPAGWSRGRPTDHQAAMFLWVLMSCCMQPLLPLFTPLMSVDE